MPDPAPSVSLADLSAAGVRLWPIEAVTVARVLIQRAAAGELRGIPSPHVVRFTPDGDVFVEGPVAAGHSVDRAARLLEAMLPGFDAPQEQRAPAALRLVVARAAGMLDVPPYSTLEELAASLRPFASPDSDYTVRAFVRGWYAAVAQAEVSDVAATDTRLTIADIRRARRATGLTLADVSSRTQLPVALLRQLEWGYFENWPTGELGRLQLVQYAHAAGLDETVVLTAALPDLEASARARDHRDVPSAAAPIVEPTTVGAPLPVDEPTRGALRDSRSRWLAALAIPALLAIAIIPAIWTSEPSPPVDSSPQIAAVESPRSVLPDPSSEFRAADEANRFADAGPGSVQRDERVAEEPRGPAAMVEPVSLRTDGELWPAFATAGSAMFQPEAADGDRSGPVLRVTSVVDGTAGNFHARPSPDGAQVAFDSDRDGERAIYLADASGANVRRISGEGFAAIPSWSPDGSRLAFVRAEPNDPRVWNIWTIHVASGETRRVTAHDEGQPWGAVWFPDGRRVAYSVADRLVVRDLEADAEQIYRSPRAGRLLRTPAVAPDGSRIIFQVHGDGAWLLDLGDGSTRKVLSDPTAEEFTWSPDGTRVAYHSRQTGKWSVWIMAPR